MKYRVPIAAHGSPAAHINVTPMIDVVMCLIIFFLLVGRLVLDRQAGIDLPETRVGEPISDRADPIIISIDARGGVRLDGQSVEAGDVGALVASELAEKPRKRVRVRADKSSTYAVIRPVLDALRDAGVSSLELATEHQP